MKTAAHALLFVTALTCVSLPATAQTTSTQTVVKTTVMTPDAVEMEQIKTRITSDLQSVLASKGYAVDVTGVFDHKTDAAVRAYQKDNGLEITGEATPDILQALGVDTTIRNTHMVEERIIKRHKLATKGSENANVYDDPNADRDQGSTFTQRYQKNTSTETAPDVTVTETTTVYEHELNR